MEVQGDGHALDEAGLQGLLLSHRPLVGLGEELLGGLGNLEPGIVQREAVGIAGYLFVDGLLSSAVGMMIRSPASVIRMSTFCLHISDNPFPVPDSSIGTLVSDDLDDSEQKIQMLSRVVGCTGRCKLWVVRSLRG